MQYFKGVMNISIDNDLTEYTSNDEISTFIDDFNVSHKNTKQNFHIMIINTYKFEDNNKKKISNTITNFSIQESMLSGMLECDERNYRKSIKLDYYLSCEEHIDTFSGLDGLKEKIGMLFLNSKNNIFSIEETKILSNELKEIDGSLIYDNILSKFPNEIDLLFPNLFKKDDVVLLKNNKDKDFFITEYIDDIKYSYDDFINKYKEELNNESIMEEINRIYKVKSNNFIQGINYNFCENNIEKRNKHYKIIASALYSVGRIDYPYFNKIKIQTDNTNNQIASIYIINRLKISRNTFNIFEYYSQDAYRFFIPNSIIDLIKYTVKYQYINTYGFYVEDKNKNNYEVINKEINEKYCLVTFDSRINKEEQIMYVKKKLTDISHLELMEEIKEIIEYQYINKFVVTTELLDKYILETLNVHSKNIYGSVYKQVTNSDMDNALSKLMKIVGCETVKHEIGEIINRKRFLSLKESIVPHTRELKKFSTVGRNNWILYGEPGVGKSFLSKLIAKIMYQEGIISNNKVIVFNSDKDNKEYKFMRELFIDATGGVFIIDEIENLSDENKKQLLQLMEEKKNDVSVIICGYKSSIMEFLNINIGFISRFTHVISVDDYSTDELFAIFNNKLEEKHFFTNKNSVKQIKKIIKKASTIKGFGQVRFIETLVDKLISIHSNRKLILLTENLNDKKGINIDPEDLYLIDNADIKELNFDELIGENIDGYVIKNPVKELEELIGCASVKNAVKEYVAKCQMDDIRLQHNLTHKKSFNMNMVFYGNPGTAKTTIARIIAKILYNKGIIESPKLIEVGASDLVAEYVGQTAKKTVNIFNEAKGGVLFIDEAYSLSNKEAGGFNREAIDTIIKEMENNRENTIVIFAGYKQQMQEFININPGFKSRISKYIDFPDYSIQELIDIFYKMIKDEGFKINDVDTDKINSRLGKYLEQVMSENNFGNGREIRTIIENAITKQSLRLSDEKKLAKKYSKKQLMTLRNEDFVFLDDDFGKKTKIIGFAV